MIFLAVVSITFVGIVSNQRFQPFCKSSTSQSFIFFLFLYTSACRTYSDIGNIDTHTYLTITFSVWIDDASNRGFGYLTKVQRLRKLKKNI